MADTSLLTTPTDFLNDAGATIPAPAAAPTAVSTPTAPTSVAPQVAPPLVPAAATGATGATGPAPPAAPPTPAPTSTFQTVSKAQFQSMSPAQQADYLNRKKAAASGVTITAPPPVAQNLWNGMSPTDRQTYIAAHPDSPEAQGKGAAAGTPAAVNAAQQAANAKPGQPAGGVIGEAGPYQAPAAANASDYQSDQSFIPSLPADEPTATTWDVTPEQTVQGQMKQLTSDLQTNPVYQSLADQLKRTAAAAGGGNSLMAESAAYNQVIGLAFNIASADAATYAKSAEFNASMSNQFSLAEQQFMHTALLSDQNYKQSQVLQSEQIKGNLDSVDRQVAGQLESTQIAADAQVTAAGETAGAMVSSASIQADASLQNAQLASTTQLKEADIQRQTTLDSINGQFQANWALQQGQTAGQIQLLGIQQAGNMATVVQQGTQQITLQTNADYNANLRQLMSGVATVGATPGLTADQQANAIKTLTTIATTNNQLSAAAAGTATHGISDGTIAGALDPSLQPTKSVAPTPDNPYGIYGTYMTFPGYDMTPPPTLPLFGGSGAQPDTGQQMPTPQPAANQPVPFILPGRSVAAP